MSHSTLGTRQRAQSSWNCDISRTVTRIPRRRSRRRPRIAVVKSRESSDVFAVRDRQQIPRQLGHSRNAAAAAVEAAPEARTLVVDRGKGDLASINGPRRGRRKAQLKRTTSPVTANDRTRAS